MPSWSWSLIISTEQSLSNKSTASTKFPSTFPATVTLAKPAPIDLDKSSTEIGFSKDFMELQEE
tara:strand:- start:179 stop:370 length:192 start_codon:yes stop_codon:yes gene_type:complete